MVWWEKTGVLRSRVCFFVSQRGLPALYPTLLTAFLFSPLPDPWALQRPVRDAFTSPIITRTYVDNLVGDWDGPCKLILGFLLLNRWDN